TERNSANLICLFIYAALASVINSAADKPTSFPPADISIAEVETQPNWSREFTVLGKHTLEQLNEIVMNILGWDRNHLYEFRTADRVHTHLIPLEEDDLFVDVEKPCASCDIPVQLLGLSVGDVFHYICDGDFNIFRFTVLEIRPKTATEVVPALLSYRGKNIVKHAYSMDQAEVQTFVNRAPTVLAPEPARDRCRIRFIRNTDRSLLNEWRASNNKKHWQKAVAILESRNQVLENIAKKIDRPEGIVHRWIKAFNRFGIEGLKQPSLNREPIKSKEGKSRTTVRDLKVRRILQIVHAKPSAYGINRSNWSRPSIASAYKSEYKESMSVSYTGYLLRQSGYSIRKARRVLTSPDPNYREKVDLLLNTLQNLKPNELFFFIDELGPLRVKKYGGRAFVRKNEVLTYPQVQAHRGVIMMSGALSATTNQMTWIYGRAKDTTAMIDLMELLYNQHLSASKLYVTWDAASWHKSTMLVEWLDAFNATTKIANEGPLIELVPLPTSSQFLDVIEAVFSGMKCAVIHHSDYRDVPEMKNAISRHFNERNAHFSENPRRAGKKIWEIDFFNDIENIRSGNYREW
ncbi:IS630 family transposase, partial [Propionivibrio sp.]|uniref:IS630 family transposase n=1 Tax=Propionivibrio sp. TaxID=2212460 RepID=UPI003BF20E86